MRDQMRISKSTIQCVEPTFDCRNHRQFAKSIFFDLKKGFSLFFFSAGGMATSSLHNQMMGTLVLVGTWKKTYLIPQGWLVNLGLFTQLPKLGLFIIPDKHR